ncbi:uncharacterized protein LOC132724043 [Ruditapes philippinarum]|uniref:uncharacterized protein LOC132724043 n=1 Tax=Ruditapes philippinarum TaxID=129788 RepID=UPI00295B35D4|nr:uncharacterized protein LOC132724043 [Ruditapes philippinarum]
MMKHKINKSCMEKGTKELSKMYEDMQKSNKSRYQTDKTSHSNYEADMEKLKQDFFEAKKLYDKDVLFQCFDEFMKSKNDEKTARYRDATGQKYKDEYDESHNEINKRMEDQLKRILDGEQKKRNQYLEKELEELRANYAELSKSVKEKLACSVM